MMAINSCPDLATKTQGSEVFLVESIFPSQNIPQLFNWIRQRADNSFILDVITKTCTNLIESGQFGRAVDFMLNEVYEHSKILANKLKIEFKDRTDLAALMEKLKHDNIISEDEWDRLTVLQMGLDGIDMEVHECGGKIKSKELNYLSEFLLTLKTILARNNAYVGVAMAAITNFKSTPFQELTIISDEGLTISTSATIINASNFCKIGYSFMDQTNINVTSTGNATGWQTTENITL